MEAPTLALFHFSEDPSISRFEPRPSASFPDATPIVWAINDERQAHYWFPRDCPRIILWANRETTNVDRARFLTQSGVPKIVAVEAAWLEAIRATTLYAYHLPPATFTLHDASAGYYISTSVVTPLGVEPVGDLLTCLTAANIEVRITPSLHPLYDAVTASTLAFSIIRFRNARPCR